MEWCEVNTQARSAVMNKTRLPVAASAMMNARAQVRCSSPLATWSMSE
jgi:hypothetical protein